MAIKIEIERKKIGFIKKAKLMIVAKNFFEKFQSSDGEDVNMLEIFQDEKMLDELNEVMGKLVNGLVETLSINGVNQNKETILDEADEEVYIGIINETLKLMNKDEDKKKS